MSIIQLGNVELPVKRLELPVVLKSTCPNCTEELEHDLRNNYLSYPKIGENHFIEFYCDECGYEHSRDLILNMSLEFEEEN